MGPKFSKEVQKYEKMGKFAVFSNITFLFLINDYNSDRMKNSA